MVFVSALMFSLVAGEPMNGADFCETDGIRDCGMAVIFGGRMWWIFPGLISSLMSTVPLVFLVSAMMMTLASQCPCDLR